MIERKVFIVEMSTEFTDNMPVPEEMSASTQFFVYKVKTVTLPTMCDYGDYLMCSDMEHEKCMTII